MKVTLPPEPPVDERTGMRVMPLEEFSSEARAEFEQTNALPRPPAMHRKVAGGAWVVNRSWYEWYASRGRDPRTPLHRPKIRPWMREAVIERDGMVCQLCGGEIPDGELHIDHIEPLAHGGATEVANLQAAHARCNIRKGARV